MKNLFMFSTMLLFFTSLSIGQIPMIINVDKSHSASILWQSQEYDFGTIESNKKAIAEFVFTNTSNEEVVVTNVKTSCGCTVYDYPKEPIVPGATATITVTYNAAKTGSFSKTIWVSTSVTDKPEVLKIKGTVQ